MAALGTLALIAAFRGLVDILARRMIPWPNLFGAETKLLQRTWSRDDAPSTGAPSSSS